MDDDSAVEVIAIPLPQANLNETGVLSAPEVEVEDDALIEGHFTIDYRRC